MVLSSPPVTNHVLNISARYKAIDTSILEILRVGLQSALKCGTFNSEYKECKGKVDWSHLEGSGQE